MRRWLALVALVAVSSWPGPSHADETPAQRLFAEGRKAMEAGDTELACSKFEESLSLEQSIGPLLNLAECNEKRGRLVRARELWKEGLAKMPTDDGRRDLAARRFADLDRRVPTIVPQGAETVAKIFIDGRPATAGEPTAVDPGQHLITVNENGPVARTLSVTVVEGQTLPIDLKLERKADAPAPNGEPDYVPAFVAFGVGGAGFIAFGVTGALWLGEKSTVDEHCPDRACDAEGIAASDSGKTLGIVNAVALGIGVAGAAVGGVLLWTASSSPDDPVAASVTLRGSGVSVDGAF